MACHFINCDRDQLFLLPPSMRDWLPEGHLVWLILDAVEELELSALLRRYRQDGWGRAAYPPPDDGGAVALCLLHRGALPPGIEQACQENVAFKVITGGRVPDHTTICRFRQQFEEELSRPFTEVLWLCGRGWCGWGRWWTGQRWPATRLYPPNRIYRHLKEEVARMPKEAEDAAEEVQPGEELLEELVDRKKRLAKLKRAKEELERLAEEAAGKGEDSSQGRRGRKPQPPAPRPDPEAKVNLTDLESRIHEDAQRIRAGGTTPSWW